MYRKESHVNWDPVENTVLANEQVIDGRGWRSGAVVERKLIHQWFLKITDFADDLVKGLDTLTGWPEKVRTMQRNWIGKSIGTDVEFEIEGIADKKIKVFTTRVDTIYGVSFMVLAPEHEWVAELTKPEQQADVDAYITWTKSRSELVS